MLTGYLVANTVILPMSVSWSRVFERKRYYMALSTVTSLMPGIAPPEPVPSRMLE